MYFFAGLEMDAWTWVTHLAIWGSIASWFIFLFVYSNFWPVLPMAADMCGIYLQVGDSTSIYVCVQYCTVQ